MPKKLRSQPPAPPDDSSRYIPLTRGKFALVDASNFDWLSQWNWYAQLRQRAGSRNKTYYAATCTPRSVGKTTILMHRVILGAPHGIEVDHEDGDGLNNRRSNIRLATSTQNKCNVGKRSNNTSGFKGVHWHKPSGMWHARITVNGKTFSLRYHRNKEQAAKAYEEAAKKYHGEFARVS